MAAMLSRTRSLHFTILFFGILNASPCRPNPREKPLLRSFFTTQQVNDITTHTQLGSLLEDMLVTFGHIWFYLHGKGALSRMSFCDDA